MISRASARLVGEVLSSRFTKSQYNQMARQNFHSNNQGAMYDFLYEEGFPAWLCNLARKASTVRGAKDFFMKLHTGESQAAATKDWSWTQRDALGQQYLKQLAEAILSRDWSSLKPKMATLQRQLELDGYTLRSGVLVPSEADVLDVGEEAGILETLYAELGLSDRATALHHLKLSEDHYLAQRWDDSISNSRKVLECVAREVAVAHGMAAGDAGRPKAVRSYLVQVGLLGEKDRDVLAATYGLLSETGSHPKMAEDEQARLLRHMALTFSQFIMLRLRASRRP